MQHNKLNLNEKYFLNFVNLYTILKVINKLVENNDEKNKSSPFSKGRKLSQGNFDTLYLGKDKRTVIKVSKPYRYKHELKEEKTKAKAEQKIFQLLYPSTPLEMRTTQKNNLGGGVLEYTLSFVPDSEAVGLYQEPTALENMNRIPFSHRVYALQTMMTQLETLHQNRIIHNDIKADNALLSKIKTSLEVQYNVPALSLIDTGLSFKKSMGSLNLIALTVPNKEL